MLQEHHSSNGPYKYDQVSRYILDLIDKGNLKPGDRAPSLRKLSRSLKVSISTINQAYLALEVRGVLKAKPQSGFYVSTELRAAIDTPKPVVSASVQPRKVRFGQLFEEIFSISNDPRIVSFAAAKPGMQLMPEKALMRETRAVIARNPAQSMDYLFPPGLEALRAQIAQRYVATGCSIGADELIITNGATEALSLCLQTVARRGDIIAVESPTYFSVLRLIEKLGMLALEIDSDPETGINLDALEFSLDTMDITAMLIVPNFNNPTGALMPEPNKARLVDMLARRDIPLIEDDVYGDLHFGGDRPGICKQYDDNGLVLSCSSFSKTVAPGFRIGWVAGGRYHNKLLEWKQATSSAAPSIQQLAMTEFLRSGQYERHLTRLRKAFREQVARARLMIARLFPEGARISNPSGAFVLWIELPRRIDGYEVYNRALQHNIGITPGMLFSATRKFKNYIRINCGFPWDKAHEDALERLAKIVHELNSA